MTGPRGILHAMKRRDFLASCAVASCATATAARAAEGRVRTGCQTRSYYVPVKDRAKLLATLTSISAAGFAGFETNQLCMAEDFANPGPMKEELAKRRLELFGLHMGARLHDAAGLEKARADVTRTAKGVQALGGKYLVLSPASEKGLAGVELQAYFHRKAEALTELGRICNGSGVRLAVHNHTEETLRGWSEFKVLAEKTRRNEVAMVVDVGPSGLTGQDPSAFLSEYYLRIAGLHIRDYRDGKQVKLGTGVVNLKGVAEALNRRQWRGWALVELEGGGIAGLTADQAARQALAYIRDEMKLGL